MTNQPDVARRTQTRAVVEAINARLGAELGLREFRVCYHDDGDDCQCRKPRPGLLRDAARDLGIDLESSFMIGDRARDIEAGKRAGCRTVLVGPRPDPAIVADRVAKDLLDAASWIATLTPEAMKRGPVLP